SASIVRSPSSAPPTAVIRPSSMPTSPEYRSAPVPSTIVPPLITRSCATGCPFTSRPPGPSPDIMPHHGRARPPARSGTLSGMTALQRVQASGPVDAIVDALTADGAVVVEDLLDANLLAGFNGELDPLVAGAQPEHDTKFLNEAIAWFFGRQTRHVTGSRRS